MQAINNTFIHLINGNKQFIIPAFQRDYSWTTEQCRQMWDDIMHAGGGDGRDHFMGSFVYVSGEATPAFSSWLVIDGQQRLTTLTLLLTALRDHIRSTSWEGQETSPEQIDAFYLRNVFESGDRSYKLALRRHDNRTLWSLIDGKDTSELTSRSELVIEAYNCFRELLTSLGVSPDEVYRGIAQLKVVDVTLHRPQDNPQQIFESLNSTGVDLTQSDLIRNYLLMGLTEPEQTQMYDDYWSKIEALFRSSDGNLDNSDNFLRDYISLKQKATTQPKADRVYAEFKGFWQTSDTDSLVSLLRDMVCFARYFVAFLRPEQIASKPLSTAMRQVRRLGSAQAMLVLRLYECYENKTLSDDEFIKALNLISSYLVRRSVLNMQTRGYWSVFARIAHSVSDEAPFESFQVALARQSYRFPSDDEFSTALRERDLYGLRICWHILSQLENAGQKEPSPVGDYSIEHILPQSIEGVKEWKVMLGDDWEQIHQTWLHRLGNLTLTAYNSSYSNRPFHEKKTIEGGFKQSAVRLNEYVRNQIQWTAAQMEERGRLLAMRAVDIWPHHDADEKLILAEEIRDLRTRSERRSADNLTMRDSVRNLFYAIRDATRELGDSIEIVEHRSLSYYDANSGGFFAESLPMAYSVRVLLPIDFDEIDDPEGVAGDVSAYKFLPNVTHRDCGVYIDVWGKDRIPTVVRMVRQAFNIAAE